ncbi:MAG TPA: hypothetical protein VGS14_02200 [Actinomycetes bacterium]|nr:hypothetical protein [Actinomycetes bacterium]
MAEGVVNGPLVLRQAEIEPFDRGTGVRTLPHVGKWNAQGNKVTTGVTEFPVGAGIPLHTHNVEESVLILEEQATAVIGEASFDLEPGDATGRRPACRTGSPTGARGRCASTGCTGGARSPARSALPGRPSNISPSRTAAPR